MNRALGFLRRWWIALLAVMLVVAATIRLPWRWTPLGDNALMQNWVDAVGTGHTPLVGGDARYGWNHLGPWLYYLFAIPYRLLGRNPAGILVGAALLNVGCIVLIACCVQAIAGARAAAIVVGGALLMVATAPGNRLIEPWNPWVQLPFLLAVVATWAVWQRRWGWLPVAVGAASLCAQAHIAYVPPAASLTVACLLSLRGRSWSETRKGVGLAGVVAVLAWLPSLIDAILPDRHNLFEVARFFLRSDPTTQPIGASGAGRVVLRETGAGASWLGNRLPRHVLADTFIGGAGRLPGLGLLILLIAGVLAWRRKDRVQATFVIIVSALLCTALVGLAWGRGRLYPYLFAWVTAVGMLSWAAGLMAIRVPRTTWARTVGALLVAALPLGPTVALIVTGPHSRLPRSPLERPNDASIVRNLVAQAEHALSKGETYRIAHGFDRFNSDYEHGVMMALRLDGYRIVVDPSLRVLFGPWMTDANAQRHPTLRVVAPYEPGLVQGTVIALSDPLDTAERAREAELVEVLNGTMLDRGCIDAARLVRDGDQLPVSLAGFLCNAPDLDRPLRQLVDLRRRGRGVAVVLDSSAISGPGG